MKTQIVILLLFVAALAKAQTPPNWTEKQLMKPSVLASAIEEKKDIPYIISVGPGAVIPGSHKMGMANTTEGMNALNTKLDSLPKHTKVVVYCGCCPFEHCPNVRPAINALKEKGFTDYYLLNLPVNIKTDWIGKGYPVINQ